MIKKLLVVLGSILYAATVVWDVLEFLFAPALFVLIGLWNGFPWQYYAISVGGYFVLFAILEVALHLIFKAFGKKFESRLERFLKKYIHDPKEDI